MNYSETAAIWNYRGNYLYHNFNVYFCANLSLLFNSFDFVWKFWKLLENFVFILLVLPMHSVLQSNDLFDHSGNAHLSYQKRLKSLLCKINCNQRDKRVIYKWSLIWAKEPTNNINTNINWIKHTATWV